MAAVRTVVYVKLKALPVIMPRAKNSKTTVTGYFNTFIYITEDIDLLCLLFDNTVCLYKSFIIVRLTKGRYNYPTACRGMQE